MMEAEALEEGVISRIYIIKATMREAKQVTLKAQKMRRVAGVCQWEHTRPNEPG